MRKGERAVVMIKPKWGYNCQKNKSKVIIPQGYQEGEKKQLLLTKRVFFEIKLQDWIMRHDINGDSLLVKTIHQKGQGFDRPSTHDEVKVNFKIYQGQTVYDQETDLVARVNDLKRIPLTVRTILESMKLGERVSTIVQPAQYIHIDKELKVRYPEIDEDMVLYIDLELKDLVSITDLFRDGTTFFKRLVL
mmetsp:Transcript_18026/g.30714  ORF Transcript_18026/g.30714 Transcript_18026/m.30714 type:complete len:191 (+) Transcript_18026:463-1035(+)